MKKLLPASKLPIAFPGHTWLAVADQLPAWDVCLKRNDKPERQGSFFLEPEMKKDGSSSFFQKKTVPKCPNNLPSASSLLGIQPQGHLCGLMEEEARCRTRRHGPHPMAMRNLHGQDRGAVRPKKRLNQTVESQRLVGKKKVYSFKKNEKTFSANQYF